MSKFGLRHQCAFGALACALSPLQAQDDKLGLRSTAGVVECHKSLFARKPETVRAKGFSYAKIHLAVSVSCKAPPCCMKNSRNDNAISR